MERAVRIVHSPEHCDLALRAAREGVVLLRNEGGLLPLNRNLKSIAVIGPNANDVRNQLGDYSSEVVPQEVITALAGIRAKAGPRTKITVAKGCAIAGSDRTGFAEAVRAAKAAEIAIVVAGESQGGGSEDPGHEIATDGEGYDVASLDLSGYRKISSAPSAGPARLPLWC